MCVRRAIHDVSRTRGAGGTRISGAAAVSALAVADRAGEAVGVAIVNQKKRKESSA
jgi:hypothetical protein